jgi:hypothetical protein
MGKICDFKLIPNYLRAWEIEEEDSRYYYIVKNTNWGITHSKIAKSRVEQIIPLRPQRKRLRKEGRK